MLLPALATAYGVASDALRLLPTDHGEHLRAELQAEGQRWYLRGCPAHIPAADWPFHLHLLDDAARPATAPGVLRSADGALVVDLPGGPYAALAWLPGEPCSHTAQVDLIQAATRLGELNRWLTGRVHAEGLPPRHVATTSDLPARFERLHGFPVLDRIRAGLDHLPQVAPVPVHGDVHPYNLLWDGPPGANTLTGFVDWDDAHLNAPTWDIAYLLTHTAFIRWPHYVPSANGRNVGCLAPVDFDLASAERLLAAWHRGYGAPLPAGGGLRRALLESYVPTLVFTLWLGTKPHEPPLADAAAAWFIASDVITDWERRLAAPPADRPR